MGDNWLDTINAWANKAGDAFIAKKITQPYELQKMQLQMYGGYGYGMGMPFDASGNPALAGYPNPGANSGRTMLLIGMGALLVFLAVKD